MILDAESDDSEKLIPLQFTGLSAVNESILSKIVENLDFKYALKYSRDYNNSSDDNKGRKLQDHFSPRFAADFLISEDSFKMDINIRHLSEYLDLPFNLKSNGIDIDLSDGTSSAGYMTMDDIILGSPLRRLLTRTEKEKKGTSRHLRAGSGSEFKLSDSELNDD